VLKKTKIYKEQSLGKHFAEIIELQW
jgi:hypothetical protein